MLLKDGSEACPRLAQNLKEELEPSPGLNRGPGRMFHTNVSPCFLSAQILKKDEEIRQPVNSGYL